ncbi:hypothetical protein NMD99_03090 [Wolbachia endosymbiont of Listronotus oregonensis]|nr:hypothetical protein [Wolbachia endosymbiont of Listronotus oregonensis]WMT84973.1 hypothetical protein NMD99_03090 [Wolbachia endosymbiont of Listronotus oregonensis]
MTVRGGMTVCGGMTVRGGISSSRYLLAGSEIPRRYDGVDDG